jgi:hypothetical protein
MREGEDDFDGSNHPPGPSLDVMDRIQELEGKSLNDLLTLAQKKLVVDLLAKLEAGQASHQELAILRNLLRDNGLVMAPRSPEAEEADQKREAPPLPDYPDPEYE